jgi:hypothetical protein
VSRQPWAPQEMSAAGALPSWARAEAKKEKLQAMRGPILETIKQGLAAQPGNKDLSDARPELMA